MIVKHMIDATYHVVPIFILHPIYAVLIIFTVLSSIMTGELYLASEESARIYHVQEVPQATREGGLSEEGTGAARDGRTARVYL